MTKNLDRLFLYDLVSVLCNGGQYRVQTDQTCSNCPLGEYQPQGTAEVCIPCFAGLSTLMTGSVLVSDCRCKFPPSQVSF